MVRKSDKQLLPVKLEAEPFFCFHFVNCYEDGEHLIVDLVAHDEINMAEASFLKNVVEKKAKCGHFRRYVLPLNVTEVMNLNIFLLYTSLIYHYFILLLQSC